MKKLLSPLVVAIPFIIGCNTDTDHYLASLEMQPAYLEAVDSICFDTSVILNPDGIVSAGEWIVMTDIEGDANLFFYNTRSSVHFPAIRRGRGPGEMLSADCLQKDGNGNIICYDYSSGTDRKSVV